MGHRAGDKHALAAVGETGPEDELAQVVEPACAAVAVAPVADKAKSLIVRKTPGDTSKLGAFASDELQGTALIGRPDAQVVAGKHPLPVRRRETPSVRRCSASVATDR